MEINHNVVGWFELPVSDMDRAVSFYENVFGFKLTRQNQGELEMAFFPWTEKGSGSPGGLVRHREYTPSADGVVLYFTAFSGDVSTELSRVEANGGKVLMPRKQISEEYGYMALFLDSEGNRIALHSRQ